MDWSFESLRVDVTILPGFLSVTIRDFFIPARHVSALDRVLQIVAFSVANYLIAWLLSPLALLPEWMRIGAEEIEFLGPEGRLNDQA